MPQVFHVPLSQGQTAGPGWSLFMSQIDRKSNAPAADGLDAMVSNPLPPRFFFVFLTIFHPVNEPVSYYFSFPVPMLIPYLVTQTVILGETLRG